MTSDDESTPSRVARVKARADAAQGFAQRTIFWRVWERMLEIELVDRSIALAGKAFVSFFPLVIVIASFVPERTRNSIYSTLTARLGLSGEALTTAKQAFASSDDIRKATGFLGLFLTILFATSFTTALQRIYLRSWRRPRGARAGAYIRGPIWLFVTLAAMATLGALRGIAGDSPLFAVFVIVALAITSVQWSFTAWFLMLGEVRWRVLLPTGVITSVTMLGYGVSASVWMPGLVERNQAQFGFFGVALSLVSWLSGAAICILIGACAGVVLAEDTGPIGRYIRGRAGDQLLADGAPESLPAPARELRLRDAFKSTET